MSKRTQLPQQKNCKEKKKTHNQSKSRRNPQTKKDIRPTNKRYQSITIYGSYLDPDFKKSIKQLSQETEIACGYLTKELLLIFKTIASLLYFYKKSSSFRAN